MLPPSTQPSCAPSLRTVIGLWFAIEDAKTLENGCMWTVPGSHRQPRIAGRGFAGTVTAATNPMDVYDPDALSA